LLRPDGAWSYTKEPRISFCVEKAHTFLLQKIILPSNPSETGLYLFYLALFHVSMVHKTLSCLLFLAWGIGQSGFAQNPTYSTPNGSQDKADNRTTFYPRIDKSNLSELRILKVQITTTQTIVSLVHTNTRPATPDPVDNWIELMPRIQIIAAGGRKTYKFIKAEGITISPEKIYYRGPGKTYFKVFFEKLDPGVELFDIFECTNFDNIICFNFYGVHVNNPDNPPPVKANKPNTKPNTRPQPNKAVIAQVTVQGKVSDEKTGKPLNAKISYQLLSNQKEITAVYSDGGGTYKAAIAPRYVYTYTVSAKGYYVYEQTLDLSNVQASQTMTRNIQLKPVEVGETVRLNNLYFPQGESTLLSSSFAELDRLAKLMIDNTGMEILIEGHTDIIGNAADNLRLSEQRVVVVKDYLVKKGIAAARIQTKAWGGTKPLVTQGSDDERAVNRRVEFKVLKK
jgi:OOP family OmpA-OmpF porin